MSTATLDPEPGSLARSASEPKVHLWTRDEYYRMADAGFFQGKRVELIGGEILDRYEEPDPRPHLWTREEYYRMLDLGLFEAKRVELIEGQVIEMSAMKSHHAIAVRLVAEALRRVFTDGYFISVQCPLNLTFMAGNDPEPDVAVIDGDIRDYTEAHPQNAELVVEISETTLRFDRQKKGSLYARAGIGEYWILNLKKRQLEVYRHTALDAAAAVGHSYKNKLILKAGDTVSPLARPDAIIKVDDLLP